MKKAPFHRTVISVVLLLALGCAVTGPGGKKSFILIGSDTEASIGQDMDQTVRQQNRILQDTLWQKYVSDIGQKIVEVCDRKDISYHFAVIDSNMVNAFAAPGGYIYLYTGLLKTMDNEAELASVIAHEVSHVVGRHSVKRLQAAMGVSLVEQLVFGQSSEAMRAVVNIGMGLAFASYSRSDENEADNFGIQYMVRAGYNPEAAVTMFEKLASMSDGSPSFFESLTMSHPDTQERIANSRALIEQMKPLPTNLAFGRETYQRLKSRLK
jgi:predicted Zn-dependent protease